MKKLAVTVLTVSTVALVLAAAVAACGEAELEGAGGGPQLAEAVEPEPGDGAVDEARRAALRTVKEIAKAVTPEMGDAHERLVKSGERSGADYRSWRDFLEPLRVEYGLTSLYTMVKVDGQTAAIVVDFVEDPDDADEWMAEYEMERAMRRAFNGRAAVRRDAPWFDPRIRNGAPHVRALAPILNADGDVVGAVGLDLEVGERSR